MQFRGYKNTTVSSKNFGTGQEIRMTGLEIWGREKALLELNYLSHMYESTIRK
jgi:hypothetical protein